MAFKISRSAFKRLCLLPLLLILFILFFYHQIANIYRNVEYKGNITVIQRAFDLFKRQPTDVCIEVELVNVGWPEGTQLSSYPQLMCSDPGFKITENDCLVYIIKSNTNDWTLEESMEEMGCRIYTYLLSSSPVEEIPKNHSDSRIHFDRLHGKDAAGQLLAKESDNVTIIDYLMIRLDGGEYEWQILSDFMAQNHLNRVKHLSMGVNLCPDRATFTEANFHFILNVDQQLVEEKEMVLFNVANDQSTFVYNPIVKEKTYCASQFSWINQRFRQDNPHEELYRNDSRQTETFTDDLF